MSEIRGWGGGGGGVSGFFGNKTTEGWILGNKLKPYLCTLVVHKYEICAIQNLKIRPITANKFETD